MTWVYFAARHWKVILPVLAALALAGYVMYLRMDNADLKKDLAASEQIIEKQAEVNRRNAEFMKRQEASIAEERKLNAEMIEATKARTSRIEEVRKELQNAPGAQERVSPHFDLLGQRLRSLDKAD